MAKRFTDTNKYKKPFIRGLQGAYKLLWDYLYHDCDHSGIWIVDFEIAQLYIGHDMPVNKVDALKYFNADEKRIVEIDGGTKWFIPSFITFQYGLLNPLNRAHSSVILNLKKYKLCDKKGLISPLQGAMDKEKEKEKDKEQEEEVKKAFNAPTIEDVRKYFKEHSFPETLANRFYDSYAVTNWIDTKGHQMRNWKQKAIQVWFKDEYKVKTTENKAAVLTPRV